MTRSAFAFTPLALALLLAMGTSAFAQEAKSRTLILPFAVLSPNPDHAWMAKAIQDNTVVVLGQGTRYQPVAYSGELKSPDVATAARLAKQSNAPYAVYGSAQVVGENVRLTAQLVGAQSGETLLTASSTGPLSDLLALEDSLAQQLSGPIPVQTPAPAATPATTPPQKSAAVEAIELEQLKRTAPQRVVAVEPARPEPDLSLAAAQVPLYTTPYFYSDLLYTGYIHPRYSICPPGSGFYFNGSFNTGNFYGTIRYGYPYYYCPPYYGGGYGYYPYYYNGTYPQFKLIHQQVGTAGTFTPGPQMSPGVIDYSASTRVTTGNWNFPPPPKYNTPMKAFKTR